MKTQLIIIIVLLVITGRIAAQGVQVGGHIRVESGAILSVMGNVDIVNGTLTIDPGGQLLLENLKNISVNAGGLIRVIGDDENHAVISSPGFFYFNVFEGGTISAENALIERMTGNGLNIKDGAMIDPEHPLYNCIIQNGSPGSTLLTIDNNQIITINGVEFNHTPGIELNNVAKYNDQGKITFTNFRGNFGGDAYELDPNARIHWIAVIPFDLALQNMTIENGQDSCFDALQMISVAGAGTTFVVESGARAEFIAGQRVLLLYGTLTESGGQLHAWITEDASYCQNGKSLVAVADEIAPGIGPDILPNPNNISYRIYPNPVSTILHIEVLKPDISQVVEFEIYDFVGRCLQSRAIMANAYHQFDFTDLPKGIYLLRFKDGIDAKVVKIIRH